MEYFLDVISILCNCAFVVACYCFDSSNETVYTVGNWLFVSGSIVNAAVAATVLLEQVYALKGSDSEKDSDRDEVMETLLFLVSALLFAVGCIFFVPHIATGDYVFAGIGAWLCILGSLGFVFAVYYNALGFEADTSESCIAPKQSGICLRQTKLGFFLLLSGGVLFSIGSFMFRPTLGGNCPPRSEEIVCKAVSSHGLLLYLAGSICFLSQSVLSLITGIFKDAAEVPDSDCPSETSKLVAAAFNVTA